MITNVCGTSIITVKPLDKFLGKIMKRWLKMEIPQNPCALLVLVIARMITLP